MLFFLHPAVDSLILWNVTRTCFCVTLVFWWKLFSVLHSFLIFILRFCCSIYSFEVVDIAGFVARPVKHPPSALCSGFTVSCSLPSASYFREQQGISLSPALHHHCLHHCPVTTSNRTAFIKQSPPFLSAFIFLNAGVSLQASGFIARSFQLVVLL